LRFAFPFAILRFSAIQATCDTRSVAREFEIPASLLVRAVMISFLIRRNPKFGY
jgi:hypothetical protein